MISSLLMNFKYRLTGPIPLGGDNTGCWFIILPYWRLSKHRPLNQNSTIITEYRVHLIVVIDPLTPVTYYFVTQSGPISHVYGNDAALRRSSYTNDTRVNNLPSCSLPQHRSLRSHRSYRILSFNLSHQDKMSVKQVLSLIVAVGAATTGAQQGAWAQCKWPFSSRCND